MQSVRVLRDVDHTLLSALEVANPVVLPFTRLYPAIIYLGQSGKPLNIQAALKV